MAVERYILICKPHTADTILSPENRKKIYATVIIFLLLLVGFEVYDAYNVSVKEDVNNQKLPMSHTAILYPLDNSNDNSQMQLLKNRSSEICQTLKCQNFLCIPTEGDFSEIKVF